MIQICDDVNQIDLYQWSKLLEKSVKASFFHSYGYCKALIESKEIMPVIIAVENEQKEITALTIGELANESKRVPFLSKRLLILDAPLYEDIESLLYLVRHLKKINAGLFVQIRTFFPFSENEQSVYMKFGFVLSDHLNAYISLTNKTNDTIWTLLKKDKRKGIKKAEEKFNIDVREYNSVNQSIDVFYEMQAKLFKRKRHALKSKDYFYNLLREAKGTIKIVFAIYEGIPIASQLYVVYNKKITALYTATLEEHLEKHAGDLLIWYLLKEGIKNKCDYFDFGGGGNPNYKYGPREYKERFGTVFENVGRFTLSKSFWYKVVMFGYNLMLKK
ncbi:hypothetical protein IE90_05805 [Sanguibacteroides justesenii]|uniref:BioF2-like acetyltransferase domain-containing protein n=2 Tax=Porphyromonadaceae TaxID=171551 RepID=A0AB34R446_9PORP|nr:hypothetical protein IE90_05805 [Sanguibacteroides justesenii]